MSNLELDEKNRRITALLKSIEELEAEVQRWKGLADLKDAKGEANRTENNNLRTKNANLQQALDRISNCCVVKSTMETIYIIANDALKAARK